MHKEEACPSPSPSVPRWEPRAVAYFEASVFVYFRKARKRTRNATTRSNKRKR